MRKYFMIAILATVLLLPIGSAQNPNAHRFAAFKVTDSLVSAAEVITIQQPATGGKFTRIERVEAWCSVACDITLERDGAAATGTSFTTSVVTFGTAVMNAFHTSDVGVGTVITTKTLPLNTIIPIVFDGGLYLAPTGTGSNFTIRTSDITGDVKITITWRERG